MRYTVDAYQPGRSIQFHFTRPTGFNFTWPVVFRTLHDALIEDVLDRAASALGERPAPRRWTLQVRVLRRILRAVS
jgi:hypothetical protein